MNHKTIVTAPSTDPIDIPLKWDRPLFSDTDGIGDTGSLSVMDGMVLAFGFIDKKGTHLLGSGVMIAPGLMVTANHVAEEIDGTPAAALSFLQDQKIRVWAPGERQIIATELITPVLAGTPYREASDVALVACTLISDPAVAYPLRMAHVEIAVPRIGERLWAVGYRELSQDGISGLAMLCSSGLVTEHHLNGRGSHLFGPCVEVAMNTPGGMSGGPVFNSEGHLVGIVSTSYEADDLRGPTFVPLIWPATVSEVAAPWPPDFWPDSVASMETAKKLGCGRLHGTATFSNGVFDIVVPTPQENR